MSKEGFANPVVDAAGTLVRLVMKSVNYVAGVSGWQITRDGDAEFNDVSMRGQLVVGVSPNPRFVIGSDIPATLAAASTDFTWYAAFITWLNATEYTFQAVGIYNPTGDAMTSSGVYSVGTGLNFATLYQNTGTGIFLLNGSAAYNPTSIVWQWRNGTAEFTDTCNVYVGGNIYKTTATQAPESWHAMTLAGGWTNFGGAFVAAQYRKLASPANSIQIVGVCSTNAGWVNGTVMTTLPAGYRPTNTVRFPVTTANPGTRSPSLEINAAGQMSILGLAGITTVEFNTIIPLDA